MVQNKVNDCIECGKNAQTDELIGILSAISVVSKRLAQNLAKREYRQIEKLEGGKPYGTSQRVVRYYGRN